MKTEHHPLHDEDVPVLAAMREATLPQKGKFFGAKARGPFDAMKLAIAPAPDVVTEPGVVGGVAGWWCRPQGGTRRDGTLLYLHGGCFALGTAEAFRFQVSHYARAIGIDTFVPEYRRAPEDRFPAAVEDAWAAYRALAADPSARLVLAGDSAGGSLALGILATAANEAVAKPRAAAVMSPWVDLALEGATMLDRADADPLFTRDVLAAFVGEYLHGHDARDPRASPLYGKLAGLAPVRIDVGDDEILLADSTRYAERASAAGADVTLAIWKGIPHSFSGAIGKLRATNEAVAAASAFLIAHLDA